MAHFLAIWHDTQGRKLEPPASSDSRPKSEGTLCGSSQNIGLDISVAEFSFRAKIGKYVRPHNRWSTQRLSRVWAISTHPLWVAEEGAIISQVISLLLNLKLVQFNLSLSTFSSELIIAKAFLAKSQAFLFIFTMIFPVFKQQVSLLCKFPRAAVQNTTSGKAKGRLPSPQRSWTARRKYACSGPYSLADRSMLLGYLFSQRNSCQEGRRRQTVKAAGRQPYKASSSVRPPELPLIIGASFSFALIIRKVQNISDSGQEDSLVMFGWCILGLLVSGTISAGQFMSITKGFLEEVVLFVALEIFSELLAFPMIILSFDFPYHFLAFFLMVAFHLRQAMVELPLKLGALLLKSSPHQLTLQLDLFRQIFPVFVNESLLITHHCLQLVYFSFILCLFCQKRLNHEQIPLQLFLSSKIQRLQLAVFPHQSSQLFPQLFIFLAVLLLDICQLSGEALILRLLFEVKRENGFNLVINLLQGKGPNATLFGLFRGEKGVRTLGAQVHFSIKYYSRESECYSGSIIHTYGDIFHSGITIIQ